jgi:hypothetical protein
MCLCWKNSNWWAIDLYVELDVVIYEVRKQYKPTLLYISWNSALSKKLVVTQLVEIFRDLWIPKFVTVLTT